MTKYFYGGEKGLPSISKKFGVSLRTLEIRVQVMGMSIEEAVNTPVDMRMSRDMKGVKKKMKKSKQENRESIVRNALYGSWS